MYVFPPIAFFPPIVPGDGNEGGTAAGDRGGGAGGVRRLGGGGSGEIDDDDDDDDGNAGPSSMTAEGGEANEEARPRGGAREDYAGVPFADATIATTGAGLRSLTSRNSSASPSASPSRFPARIGSGLKRRRGHGHRERSSSGIADASRVQIFSPMAQKEEVMVEEGSSVTSINQDAGSNTIHSPSSVAETETTDQPRHKEEEEEVEESNVLGEEGPALRREDKSVVDRVGDDQIREKNEGIRQRVVSSQVHTEASSIS